MDFKTIFYQAFNTVQTARKKEAVHIRKKRDVSDIETDNNRDCTVEKSKLVENERIGNNINIKV